MVFARFKLNLFTWSKEGSFTKYKFNLCSKSTQALAVKMFVSSAYIIKSGESGMLQISLRYAIYNSDPNMEPCGTPWQMVNIAESLFSTLTYCVRLVKELFKRCIPSPRTPLQFSLLKRTLCWTQWNALRMSKNKPRAYFLHLILFTIFFYCEKSLFML